MAWQSHITKAKVAGGTCLAIVAALAAFSNNIHTIIAPLFSSKKIELKISGIMFEPISFYERQIARRGTAQIPDQYGLSFVISKAHGVALKDCHLVFSHPTLDQTETNSFFREKWSFDVSADVESVRKISIAAPDRNLPTMGQQGTSFVLECTNSVTEPTPLPRT
ncbi:hypothetical protein A6R70_01905 [Agrobacterium rubi]|uniref:hypothetical protein n=1 Tax=Agrobacterium rubi TaxID=28099 RepID=UPI0005EBB813|nr:hypothetical protein [Agrobacterium rubi]MBP1876845.1 hypothetical protein [Agrobacterium rubi]MCL6651038.1 hypothetical protein [Agrobacterium rubi]